MTAINVGLIIQITKESVEPQPNDPLSDIKFITRFYTSRMIPMNNEDETNMSRFLNSFGKTRDQNSSS